MEPTLHVYIGYDAREHIPFRVAEYSIKKRTQSKVQVHRLDAKELREKELFTRMAMIDSNGQLVDMIDRKPFSTQFSFTRFLVPELWRELREGNKCEYAIFVDCDFVFLESLDKLLEDADHAFEENKQAKVAVVKHDYTPLSRSKMDGVQQTQYNKKLWSSLMVFHMGRIDEHTLNKHFVNNATGGELHQFKWLRDDSEIAELPGSWNFIPSHSKHPEQNAIHFTEGGPWFKGYKHVQHAELWTSEFEAMMEECPQNKLLDFLT